MSTEGNLLQKILSSSGRSKWRFSSVCCSNLQYPLLVFPITGGRVSGEVALPTGHWISPPSEGQAMQLYHHPFSLDSQKVRLALEEKGIDYTSYHVNPITGKNLDSTFFRMNPTAKLPVFQNGAHVMYDTIEIIQYIERISIVTSGSLDEKASSSQLVVQWMHKIQEWNPKYFTLNYIPEKYRLMVTKFLRRVTIARLAESPDLAPAYHRKLRQAYEIEDKLKNSDAVKQNIQHLNQLLDEVEAKLSESAYLGGEEFSMADVMLIPVLSRIAVLELEEYIKTRPNVAEYWLVAQERPSYKKVIGRYFKGWRKHKTLVKTWFFVHFRSLLKKY